MPFEAFFKLLARKNLAADVNSVEMSGDDAVKQPTATAPSENVADKASSKEKDRKRHRDGGGSCHHHKKNKDVPKTIVLEDGETVVKEGVEPQGLEVSKLNGGVIPKHKEPLELPGLSLHPSVPRSSVLASCKGYAEKV